MVDPGSIGGSRRRIRTSQPRGGNGGGGTDNNCLDFSGCDLPGCDLPGCDGCDLPCDIFHIGLLGMLAQRTPQRPPRRRVSGPALAGVAAIRGYQRWLSPRLPTACPHTPTCSGYGIDAIRRYGLAAGVRLTAGRITRCTSAVSRGTVDQVP